VLLGEGHGFTAGWMSWLDEAEEAGMGCAVAILFFAVGVVLALLGLAVFVLHAIRLLNQTWFDPDWQAARGYPPIDGPGWHPPVGEPQIPDGWQINSFPPPNNPDASFRPADSPFCGRPEGKS
jgi:hypothetical protein